MSHSNTPSPLSNDGLRYTTQELEILTQLSALDADNFVNHTNPVATVPVIGRFRAMALGILRNPHLPAPDPSIAARLCTEWDEARAQNNVLQGQVRTLENERTLMMAEGAPLTEQVTTLNETIQELHPIITPIKNASMPYKTTSTTNEKTLSPCATQLPMPSLPPRQPPSQSPTLNATIETARNSPSSNPTF